MPDDSTLQERESVLATYAGAYNRGRFEDLPEVLHEDFTIYGALGADGPLDRDGYREGAEHLRAAFPDLELGPNEGVGRVFDDDTSAHRARFRGTHTGTLHGIEPTGNAVDIDWPWVARWQNGKIIEKWDHPDVYGLLSQLGVVDDVL